MNKNKMLLALNNAKVQVHIYEVVIPVIDQYREKVITKRVATAIEKELPGYTVSYNPDKYGYRSIAIWGNGLSYEHRFDIDFMQPNDYMTCKTEKEAIVYAIDSAKARLSNTRQLVAALEFERDNWSAIESDFKKIVQEHQKAIKLFNAKYGKKELTTNEPELTYVAREALEEVTGVKLSI